MNQIAKPLSDSLTKSLWRMMGSTFGHRWISSYGESDVDDIWARGLAGLTAEDIGRGVRACVDLRMDWPPSMPEFRGLCLPTDAELGLPSIELAYRAAARLDWSLHPAVYVAAKAVGTYRMRNDAEAVTRPKFSKAWADVVERVRRGEVIEQPVQDVPRLGRCEKARKETGRAHVANIQAILRGEIQA